LNEYVFHWISLYFVSVINAVLVIIQAVLPISGTDSGVFLWLAVGFSPDNSGGTTAFLLGAVLMSGISVIAYFINKNRWMFYGLNLFTLLVCIFLFLSIIRYLSSQSSVQ